MTFSCRNYDFNLNNCQKLKSDCIPGRRGCVLEGRVKLSEELEKKVAELEAGWSGRRGKRRLSG
ncbi:hypothetical protein ACHHRT_00195 [Desulfurivibrio sp. D14AmB]|uniref:hypothetical protein n=1 Tax=Desulfurivibrio sp. D14AmB TaxID=3374370 RepID=UPI00376EF6F7